MSGCAICHLAASGWWAILDHRGCDHPRQDVLLRPTCPDHVHLNGQLLMLTHRDCDGHLVHDAGAIDNLVVGVESEPAR